MAATAAIIRLSDYEFKTATKLGSAQLGMCSSLLIFFLNYSHVG